MDRPTLLQRSSLVLALALCAPLAVQAQDDPAYVDSAAGRSIPDPARADGGTYVATAPPAAAPSTAGGLPNMAPLMQMQALQAAQQQPLRGVGPPTGMGQPGAVPGIGQPMAMGRGYGPAMELPAGVSQGYGMPAGASVAPQAGPWQQVRSGLMQDVGGLIDARIQRQIYGPDGPVTVYPAPGVPPTLDGSGW